WVATDQRRALWFEMNTWGGYQEGNGTWDFGVSPGVNFRPTAQASISVRPEFNRTHNTWQYVDQVDAGGRTHYLMALLDQRTVSVTTRLNYTIRPTLSFELYAQPFVSAGDYTGYKAVTNPRAARFEDRFE